MAILDCFLVNEEWDSLFGNVVQVVLLRSISDHFPVSLEGGHVLVRGPSPFRFENVVERRRLQRSNQRVVARTIL